MDDLAAELKRVRPSGWIESDPVFGDAVPSIEQLKVDLAAAGIPWQDALGRQADFHALRKTYNTMLQGASLTEARVMQLMRVSDRRLIDKTYLDTTLLGSADDLDRLPRFEQKQGPEELRKTGTEDAAADYTQKRTQNLFRGVFRRLRLSKAVRSKMTRKWLEMQRLVRNCPNLSALVWKGEKLGN